MNKEELKKMLKILNGYDGDYKYSEHEINKSFGNLMHIKESVKITPELLNKYKLIDYAYDNKDKMIITDRELNSVIANYNLLNIGIELNLTLLYILENESLYSFHESRIDYGKRSKNRAFTIIENCFRILNRMVAENEELKKELEIKHKIHKMNYDI